MAGQRGRDVSAAMEEEDELGGLVAVADPEEGGLAVREGLDVVGEAGGEEGGFFGRVGAGGAEGAGVAAREPGLVGGFGARGDELQLVRGEVV